MNLSIPRRRKSAVSHRLTFPLSHLLLVAALLAQLSTFNPQLTAATFTNNVTLTETNNTYDGQDIVISGATVTIDGPHSFNSPLLTNSAVLTHSSCTTPRRISFDLTGTGLGRRGCPLSACKH